MLLSTHQTVSNARRQPPAISGRNWHVFFQESIEEHCEPLLPERDMSCLSTQNNCLPPPLWQPRSSKKRRNLYSWSFVARTRSRLSDQHAPVFLLPNLAVAPTVRTVSSPGQALSKRGDRLAPQRPLRPTATTTTAIARNVQSGQKKPPISNGEVGLLRPVKLRRRRPRKSVADVRSRGSIWKFKGCWVGM